MKYCRSCLTALSRPWFVWDIKEPTTLCEKSGGRSIEDVDPSGVTNLSWAGCIICEERY